MELDFDTLILNSMENIKSKNSNTYLFSYIDFKLLEIPIDCS